MEHTCPCCTGHEACISKLHRIWSRHVHTAQDMEQAGTWQNLADREETGEWCCPYPRSNFLDEMLADPLETEVSREPKSLPWTCARGYPTSRGI